jgi:DNA-binding PadR family transcriptional regulator
VQMLTNRPFKPVTCELFHNGIVHGKFTPMRVPLPDETILGILAAKPQHGYELLSHFRSNAELGRVWTLSTSQLYAVLKRLEKAKLIRGRVVDSGTAPTRREYSIRSRGRARLDRWLHVEPLSSSIRQVRIQFISRLYVFRLLDESPQNLIARQRQVCENQLDHFKSLRQHADTLIGELTAEFVVHQLEAVLDWLNKCEESVLVGP